MNLKVVTKTYCQTSLTKHLRDMVRAVGVQVLGPKVAQKAGVRVIPDPGIQNKQRCQSKILAVKNRRVSMREGKKLHQVKKTLVAMDHRASNLVEKMKGCRS